MQYIGSNIRFIFTKIKELLNSHNTNSSAHSELFNSWTLLRDPTNAEIADALAVTHKNGIGDVLVHVANTQTFALEDMKLFFRPARFQQTSATESHYEGIYITMDGTQGRYVAKTFADSEIMTPEGPSTISTPSELALYPAASDAVLYTPQTLTEAQQKQARANIGALDVNIETTPVDTNRTFFGVGKNIVYVKNGWLKPCPADADKELAANYANAVLGFGFINLDISVVKGEAKSAFSLYQQGLISDKGTILKNPLDVAQYITWTVGITNNKTYIDYRHVEHNGFYEYCRYFEDDTYSNLRASYSLSNYMSDSEPRGSVSQFRMSTAPTEDMHIATKQYVDTAKTEAQQLGLTTATPGKTIKVKAVQGGKPTEWETADIYEKPTSGIPKSDLEQSVQTSLAKADTAISYDSQTLTDAQKQQARTNIGAGQSDWNQNDETAADYVKNRPFYTGDPVETVLVEESTVSFADAGGLYVAQFPSTFEATVGETYKVSWDGTTYECACVNFNNNLVFGNLSVAGAGSDTGEPFFIAVINGEGLYIYTADTSASHTFSISGLVSEVVKIDEKYLPEYSVLYSGNPADWSDAKKQQMYYDFISGKLLLYSTSSSRCGIVLYAFYSKNVGLTFTFFETYNGLTTYTADGFSKIDLSEYGINSLIKDQINNLSSWKLYSASSSEVSVGDLLSMYLAFDSTTNKACILTNTKSDIGSTQLKSPIVTNGDADITLSSSTAGSTKKFKITVDDSGVPTITDESDSTNTWKPTNLPTVTSSDSGKFLRVSDTGEWVAETILSATVSNNTLIIR